MKHLGYYNGAFGEIETMTVPMNDRVCYFGDGVYDASYSRNYKIFALDEHIDRLYNSAALLRIDIHETKEEMRDILTEMVQKMDTGENFVYWQVTRGTAMRKHVFPKEGRANLWIVIYPKKIVDTYKKIRLMTKPDTRFFHCNIKTLNLILPGIARAHLIGACRRLGIPVDETPFTVEEMMAADEVIVTSSGSLCLAAEEIDGKAVGGGAAATLRALQDAVVEEFMAATE